MVYLCVAETAVFHQWYLPEPPPPGLHAIELKDCPDHDGLPQAEGEEHRLAQEERN